MFRDHRAGVARTSTQVTALVGATHDIYPYGFSDQEGGCSAELGEFFEHRRGRCRRLGCSRCRRWSRRDCSMRVYSTSTSRPMAYATCIDFDPQPVQRLSVAYVPLISQCNKCTGLTSSQKPVKTLYIATPQSHTSATEEQQQTKSQGFKILGVALPTSSSPASSRFANPWT
jgi:hypothetical protein